LLRGFAGRCLPAGEAEDAAQETLRRVFSRASEFDPRRDALTWTLGIAAWQIRTTRRRARRRREDSAHAIPEPADATPSPETAAMAREASEALDRALADLSSSDSAMLLAFARGERPDSSRLPAPASREQTSSDARMCLYQEARLIQG
jgi:RNA polymerase sigma factor (sigma-70 family)